MGQPPVNDKPSRSFFVRLLWFCLRPEMLLLIALILGSLLLVPPVMLMTTRVTLPDFAAPEQEDFWSLQKKLVDIEPSAAASIQLTYAEFNAFLSRFQPPPEGGFCLHRLRCIADKERATIYAIGSGFFIRNLIFQIHLNIDNAQINVERLQINSLELSGNNLFATYVVDYLKKLATGNSESSVARILNGKGNVEFQPGQVLLRGEFMPTLQKSETEELPVVEIEEIAAEN